MTAFGPAALSALGRPGAADAISLSALVRESVETGQPRQALHLRLAPLGLRLRREHHHRLLREAIEPVLRPSRARLFALPNGDLVAVGPADGRHLEEVAARLTTLLGDLAGAPSAQGFAAMHLPGQAACLLAALEAALSPGTAPGMAAPGAELAEQGGGEDAPEAAPDAWLERGLAAANLEAYLRCRPVLRAEERAEGPPERQWTEWRVAVPELRAALAGAAGGPASPGPALPRHLRAALDRRLLAGLSRPEEMARQDPIGLALGLAALDSREFRRLDAGLGPLGRAGTVIGLALEEVLSNPAGFQAARAVLRGRGYRLAVDIAHPGALALLAPGRAGFDLARLPWHPDLPAAWSAGAAAPETMPRAWRGRVVMLGTDCAAALGWGWQVGISLFEGRLLRA